MRKMIQFITTILMAGSVLFSVAQADPVLIDFGNDSSYRGLSVVNPDQNGNYWNSVKSGQYWPGLVDINGTTSTVAFGFGSAAGTDSYNGPAGATSTDTNSANYYVTKVTNTTFDAVALGDLGATNAVFDFYASTNTFTIQGLDPAKTYTITFFASHKYTDAYGGLSTYTVYTSNDYSTVVASDTLAHNDEPIDGASFAWRHNQDRTVSIENISPQYANSLWIKSVGYINALKIEEYVEPPVAADTLVIDFGADNTYRALSVVNPDENGIYWNNRGFSTLNNMLATNNVSTDIDLVTTSSYGVDSYNGPAGATSTDTNSPDYFVTKVTNTAFNGAALGALGATNAVFDSFRGTDITFELQGLDPDKMYHLSFFGSQKYSTDATTRYSVTDSNGTVIASADLDVCNPSSTWLHNQDTVAVISNAAPDAANTIYVTFSGTGGNTGYLNSMMIQTVLSTNLTTFDIWAIDNGVSPGTELDDDDGDGLDNLSEYALGGNPTDGVTSSASLPELMYTGSGFEYVHAQRTNGAGVVYYLEISDDLVSGSWSNAGYTVVGTNVTGGALDFVTNQVPAVDSQKFIRLQVEAQ